MKASLTMRTSNMKINQLIKQLQTYPARTEIYMSGDPEGNDIRKIEEVAEYEMEEGSEYGSTIVVIWPTDTILDL